MAGSQKTKVNTATPATPSAEEVLSFLSQNGTIDMRDVLNSMNKSRREKVLEQHKYSIYQGSDGRWYTHVPDSNKSDGRRKIVKTAFDDLVDALCKHYQFEDNKPKTMASLFDEWIAYKKEHVEPTTIERTLRDWKRYYANSKIIHKPLVSLTKVEIDVWVHQMIKKHNMGKHQYANFRSIIRQELQYAVDTGVIPVNLFDAIKVDTRRLLRPEKKKDDRTQVYSKEEVNALYKLAKEDFDTCHYSVHQLAPLAVMFMFLTGLRIGEVCAIRYEDVEAKNLHVRRMMRHPSQEIVEHTKGTYGERLVPLVPAALDLIAKAKAHQQSMNAPDDGYIFSMRETPLLYTSVSKAFYRYCKDLGIEPKSSHKARKTFISTLLDADVNLNTVRQIAGHVDERTTLNNYCYDRSSDDEKYDKMSRALA